MLWGWIIVIHNWFGLLREDTPETRLGAISPFTPISIKALQCIHSRNYIIVLWNGSRVFESLWWKCKNGNTILIHWLNEDWEENNMKEPWIFEGHGLGRRRKEMGGSEKEERLWWLERQGRRKKKKYEKHFHPGEIQSLPSRWKLWTYPVFSCKPCYCYCCH